MDELLDMTPMTRSLFILIFIGVLTASGQETNGSLEGVVRDASSSAVANAIVELTPGAASAKTGEEGRFQFEGLAAGRYSVTVTSEEFEPVTAQVRITPGRVARMEFELAIATVRSEVTVSGDRPADLRERVLETYEANKSVTTMEGQALAKNNLMNNYDALRLMPGVSTAAFGGRDRFSTPSHIRGNGAWGKSETLDDYPAVQVVPVSAEDGGYTAGFSSIIPSISIEEMSLATGGLGVVYGQATGGVVRNRIKTGDPAAPHATLRAEGIGVGEVVAMGDASGGAERFDYYVSGQTAGADYGTNFDTYPRPIQGLRAASGLAKGGYRVSDKGRLEGMFIGGDERHSFFQIDGQDVRHDYHTEKDNYFWAGRYDHRFSDKLVGAAGATHNRFHENRIEDFADGAAVDVSRRNRPQRASTLFADLTWQTRLSENVFYAGSAGSEVRRDRFADITNSPIEFQFGEDALYVRNSLSYDALTVNAGVRGTRIDNAFETNDRTAYDVGLAYRLPTRTRLKASYSTGYRLNKPFYLWWGGGNFVTREPSNGIRPSNTRTTEFGAEQAFGFGSGVSGTVRASAFRTDEKDLFNFGNTNNGTPYYDQLRVDGFELWSQWRVGRLRPFLSYTWLDNVRTGSDNLGASNVDLRFTPLPGKSAGFGVFAPLARRFDFSIMGSYDSGGIQEALVNDQIVLTRFEEFLKVNALFSVAVTDRLSLLVRAENLLNRRDLGYSRSVLQMDGSSQQIAGTQRDPGLILAGGVQWGF